MKTIKAAGSFKKDLKRYPNQSAKLRKLYEIVELLRCEQPLPQSCRPHMLIGDYAGCMECHIEGDFLLIWIDEASDEIRLVRLGSHSQLFG